MAISAHLEYRGKLVHEYSLEGETRAAGRFPRHINGLQLSPKRYLLMMCSGAWRGADDNRSAIYQIRDGTYDGPVIREGFLRKSIAGWDALEDGKPCILQTVHPIGFGVPHGAVIGGRVPDHAGLFVMLWKRHARYLDPETGFIPRVEDGFDTHAMLRATTVVEWVQVRLNPSQDDLEIVQPAQTLRQTGWGAGYPFCERQEATLISTTMSHPVPVDESGTAWVGPQTFYVQATKRVGVQEFQYDPAKGLYEWTRTGPLSADGLWEPSIMRYGDSWLISARTDSALRGPNGERASWMRIDDPLGDLPDPLKVPTPESSILLAFTCADGVVRVIANDPHVRPHWPGCRNPLYVWDVDPDNHFAASNVQTLFDAVERKMAIREEAGAVVDQGKFFPHAGGNRQVVAHRVRTLALENPAHVGFALNEAEKDAHGLYYSEMVYDQEYPAAWDCSS